MQFKYNFVSINEDRIPVVDVRLENPKTGVAFDYPAMLDSGAFANVFHADIADLLGIDLSKLKEIKFGGVKDSTAMKGKMAVVKLKIIQKGRMHSFDAYVIFSKEVSNTGQGLLGRQGFFDHFDDIVFNFKKNEFFLRNND